MQLKDERNSIVTIVWRFETDSMKYSCGNNQLYLEEMPETIENKNHYNGEFSRWSVEERNDCLYYWVGCSMFIKRVRDSVIFNWRAFIND